MTTEKTHYEGEYKGTGTGAKVPFEYLNEPGTYICNWSGHLLRVPEDAIKPGRSPVWGITAKEPLFVTKLSNDPYMTVSKARMIAADWDVAVNF
jgi:hypothetical protein